MSKYHYTTCGLPNIWLKNGYSIMNTKYGESVSIHDIEGLHRAIGRHLLDKPMLDSAELRFLRKELDLSQLSLASLLGVGESAVRSWESGRSGASLAAEKILRLLYQEKINGKLEINSTLERLSKLNREIHETIILLEETDSGWKEAV